MKRTFAEYKKEIESTFHYLINKYEFYGNLLQQFNIKLRFDIPTAGVMFSASECSINLYINPDFLIDLPIDERVGIIIHETLHFTHKHLLNFKSQATTPKEQHKLNIAMDMSINQYIKHLPEGCVNVSNFKYKDDKGVLQEFPKYKPHDFYLKLLEENQEENKEEMDKFTGCFFDNHDWEELDEDTKKQLLEEAKKLAKRAFERLPEYSIDRQTAKDFLQELDGEASKIDHRRILQQAVTRNLINFDRISTWARPSKRYGIYSAGSVSDKLPSLFVALDTSGSITYEDLKTELNEVSRFFKKGAKKIILGLWHTALYSVEKYSFKKEIANYVVESGGTDVTETLQYIQKHKPDLAMIITDMYFDMPDIKTTTEVIWIGLPNCNMNQKIPKGHKFILLSNLKR